ncbi:hypothetical protein MYBA111488_23135 [Mycobacterium basiliense]
MSGTTSGPNSKVWWMFSGMVGRIWMGSRVMGPIPVFRSSPIGIAGMLVPADSPNRPW